MAKSDGIDFDFSGVNALVATLGAVPAHVIPRARQAVEITARNIKTDWRDEAQQANAGGHARRYPSSVDYDMELDKDGSIGAEIGPNLAKSQGQLGFLEESPGDVASAPQGNARKALRKNLADFEAGALKATEGML